MVLVSTPRWDCLRLSSMTLLNCVRTMFRSVFSRGYVRGPTGPPPDEENTCRGPGNPGPVPTHGFFKTREDPCLPQFSTLIIGYKGSSSK